MGDEAYCALRLSGRVSEGKALLESDELLFRGDRRLKIPLTSIRSVSVQDGWLTVDFPDGEASFELGRAAERWASKIRQPKTLLDKLGVKPGLSVAALGIEDQQFRAQLEERVGPVHSEPVPETDLIFLSVERHEDLDQLGRLRKYLKPNGGIWMVSPKGKQASVPDVDVMAAAKKYSLVDVKIASFSTTHTALKLVIPRALR